jgi:hypothetical protein
MPIAFQAIVHFNRGSARTPFALQFELQRQCQPAAGGLYQLVLTDPYVW